MTRHLLVILVLVFARVDPAIAQTLHLTMHAEPGELLTGGGDWDITYTVENSLWVEAALLASSGAVQPDILHFSALFPEIPDFYFHASFSSQMMGVPLTPGTYEDAQKWGKEEPGHPGMNVSFQHISLGALVGSFVIHDLTYHQSGSEWIVDYVSLSFSQQAISVPIPLTGTITYTAPGPSALALLGIAACCGQSFRRRRN